MRPCTSFTGVALPALLLVGVAGCDDSPVTTPSDGDGTMVDVSMSPGDTRFEYRSEAAEGPGGSTFPGPLVIAGSNVRYDEETSALIVDLTVRNEGEAMLPMPVSLVLVHLAPEGVTVLDADNGESGPGARIDFDFANDDLHWTPGEESFPRSVSFGVEPGISVAFAARFLVGPPEDEVGGRIGGIVWNDADGDGERDADERGIPDVRLRLVAHEDSSGVGTRTNAEGRYVFRGLSSGSYTIAKLPRDDLVPTTPSRLTVLLTESEGEVSDFLHADFGCRLRGGDDDEIEVGDRVRVVGSYERGGPAPDRIVAAWIAVRDADRDDGSTDEPWGDHTEWSGGTIRGPVTGIAESGDAIQIMGTEFRIHWTSPPDSSGEETPRVAGDGDCPDGELDLDDIEVGDRVLAHVVLTDATSPDEPHLIRAIYCWDGEREGVSGPVESVGDLAGDSWFLRVLHTMVVVTPETEIDSDE